MTVKSARTLEAKLTRIEEGSSELLSSQEADNLYRLERPAPDFAIRAAANSPHRGV